MIADTSNGKATKPPVEVVNLSLERCLIGQDGNMAEMVHSLASTLQEYVDGEPSRHEVAGELVEKVDGIAEAIDRHATSIDGLADAIKHVAGEFAKHAWMAGGAR